MWDVQREKKTQFVRKKRSHIDLYIYFIIILNIHKDNKMEKNWAMVLLGRQDSFGLVSH